MSGLQGAIAARQALQTQLDSMKENYNEALDTIWMLFAAVLVFLMHAGFSLLEAGCVRQRNTQHILTKNLLVVCVGFLCWFAFGWAFAYGAVEDPNRFIGGTQFFADGFLDDRTLLRQWLFQGAFCATGATIVSGSMAERTRLFGFAVYTVVMTTWIYPVVVYWGWSGNGIFAYTDDDGESVSIVGPTLQDFAGSGIVHMVGGFGALCGAFIVGPRAGRFDEAEEGKFDAHHIPFCVLGTFILWFGWYGFNPGSTLAMHTASSAHQAGLVAVNTTISPCVAGLVVFALRRFAFEPKKLDVGGFGNGVLAGLVSITAGCAFVKPWETVIIGLVGGLLYQLGSMLLQQLKVDDVVDAFPVHGICGCWGVIAVGFFGNDKEGNGGNGVLYGGDQLGVQIVFVIFVTVWSGFWSVAAFFPLKLAGLLRESDETQEEGADCAEHSPPKAYNGVLPISEVESKPTAVRAWDLKGDGK